MKPEKKDEKIIFKDKSSCYNNNKILRNVISFNNDKLLISYIKKNTIKKNKSMNIFIVIISVVTVYSRIYILKFKI